LAVKPRMCFQRFRRRRATFNMGAPGDRQGVGGASPLR
jgi:hypothetical protein